MEHKMKYYGYANDWTWCGVPPKVQECFDQEHKLIRKEIEEHKLIRKEIERCLYRVECPICKYYYHVDSSG